MIRILSTFLGLVTGMQPVALDVPDATSVEIHLDGAVVERVARAPLEVTVNLGDDLAPHRVSVVAYRDEREIGRAMRWINISEDAYLSDTLESTPIAVRLVPGAELPSLSELGSWFRVEGRPAEVLAVDDRPPEIILIRDPAVQPILDAMDPSTLQPSSPKENKASLRFAGEASVPGSDPDSEMREMAAVWQGLRSRLGDDTTLRFISPRAAPVSQVSYRKHVFDIFSQPTAPKEGFLYQMVKIRPHRPALRLADAVAVAGYEAHGGARRRAVVLLTTMEVEDAGRYSAPHVRRYLEALHVPLHVWSFGSPDSDRTGLVGWGDDVREIVSDSEMPANVVLARFREALRELGDTLEAQRVVRLRGRYLPQQIEIADGIADIVLAGSPMSASVKTLESVPEEVSP